MKLELESFVGILPLKFGMTQFEVAAIAEMGPPKKAFDAYDGSLNEFRTMDLPVCNYVDGALSAIDTNFRVGSLMFRGMDLYKESPSEVCYQLHELNGYTLVGLGGLLYPELGISTGGFYDEETGSFYIPTDSVDDDRGISAFRKGAFDALLDSYTKLDIEKLL